MKTVAGVLILIVGLVIGGVGGYLAGTSQTSGSYVLSSGQRTSNLPATVTVSGIVTCYYQGCQLPDQILFASVKGQQEGEQFVVSITSQSYSIKLSNDNMYVIQSLGGTQNCNHFGYLLVNTTQSSMTDDIVC